MEVIIDFLEKKHASNECVCFEMSKNISTSISKINRNLHGIVLIKGQYIKFTFSPLAGDGSIASKDIEIRSAIKKIVPEYISKNIDNFIFVENKGWMVRV